MLVENDSDIVSSLQPLPPVSEQVPVTVTAVLVQSVFPPLTEQVGAVLSILTV